MMPPRRLRHTLWIHGISGHRDIGWGNTTWRIDTSFLTSNWSCIWGRGCQGIFLAQQPKNSAKDAVRSVQSLMETTRRD